MNSSAQGHHGIQRQSRKIEAAERGANSIRAKLEQAYQCRLERFFALLKDWSALAEDLRPLFSEWVKDNRVVSEMIELERWVHPEDSLKKSRLARAETLTRWLDLTGAPYEVTHLFRRSILRARGRPSTRRAIAFLALGAKRTDPSFTWGRFARNRCDCGKGRHDKGCEQSIRQTTIALAKLLKKYRISP